MLTNHPVILAMLTFLAGMIYGFFQGIHIERRRFRSGMVDEKRYQ